MVYPSYVVLEVNASVLSSCYGKIKVVLQLQAILVNTAAGVAD